MTRHVLIAAFAIVGLTSTPVFTAEESAKTPPTLTKEERQVHADKYEKMAELHKSMAECLRSDKTSSECHEQMRKDCPMAKDGVQCPMMHEMKGMGVGKMKGRGRGLKNEKGAIKTNDE